MKPFLGDIKVEIVHIGVAPQVKIILDFIVFEEVVDDSHKLIFVSLPYLGLDSLQNSKMRVG